MVYMYFVDYECPCPWAGTSRTRAFIIHKTIYTILIYYLSSDVLLPWYKLVHPLNLREHVYTDPVGTVVHDNVTIPSLLYPVL